QSKGIAAHSCGAWVSFEANEQERSEQYPSTTLTGVRSAQGTGWRLGFVLSILFLTWFSAARAQTQPAGSMSAVGVGEVTRDFSFPQINEKGKVEAMLTGKEARTITANRTQISDMKIEVYDGDTVTTTITSPKCDLWNMDKTLRTRSGVVITK